MSLCTLLSNCLETMRSFPMPKLPLRVCLATRADRDELIEHGTNFLAETGHSLPMHRENVERTVDKVLKDGFIYTLSRAGCHNLIGYIGVLVDRDFLTGDMTAYEVAWYVVPEERKGSGGFRMLQMAEQHAKAAGATVMKMSALTVNVGRFLERRGYTPLQTTYTMDLT